MTTRKTKGPTRAQATRWAGPGTGGYPSDLTDAQWQVIVPHLPAERPGRRGRPRIWPARRIVEAILYLDRTGCAWRYLPTDYPPWQTVYGYFAAWRDDGTLARLHGELRARARAAAGRKPQPTAAVIDSQSVRAADTVPKTTRGWDAAKKVNGRKRHIAVDTTGLVLDVVITAACVQDRDAARPLLWNTRRACRGVRLVWADAGYTGKLATWAAAMKMTLQIVAKRDPHAFEILPRRWVVERTFAWISKHRRTTRDYEHLPASHEAMILWAMIALMTRRLAQSSHLSDTHYPAPRPVLPFIRHSLTDQWSASLWLCMRNMLRVAAFSAAVLAPILVVQPASAAVTHHAGSCRISGDFAVCVASGNATGGIKNIYAHVSASPNQSVDVSWSMVCVKGSGGYERSAVG